MHRNIKICFIVSLLCALTISGITFSGIWGSTVLSNDNALNCLAYDPAHLTPLYGTKAVAEISDESVSLSIEYKGTVLRISADYTKEFTDDSGTTVRTYEGNATDGKNIYPARFHISDDGKTRSGRVMGKNFGGPNFAFVLSNMSLQQMELALNTASLKMSQQKALAIEQEQTKQTYEGDGMMQLLLNEEEGRFGNWVGDYWKVTVVAPKEWCSNESKYSYDCQLANSFKPIKAYGWMTNSFTHDYCMDTVEYIFYSNPYVNWMNPTPTTTPMSVQWSYSVSIGVGPLGIGFGAGTTFYSVLTHTDTSQYGRYYHFYFDYVSVPMQYLEYHNSETYPEGTGVWIQHVPYTTLQGQTVQCTITSYNHPLFNSGGDVGWIPTTFGPASGTFNIKVH